MRLRGTTSQELSINRLCRPISLSPVPPTPHVHPCTLWGWVPPALRPRPCSLDLSTLFRVQLTETPSKPIATTLMGLSFGEDALGAAMSGAEQTSGVGRQPDARSARHRRTAQAGPGSGSLPEAIASGHSGAIGGAIDSLVRGLPSPVAAEVKRLLTTGLERPEELTPYEVVLARAFVDHPEFARLWHSPGSVPRDVGKIKVQLWKDRADRLRHSSDPVVKWLGEWMQASSGEPDPQYPVSNSVQLAYRGHSPEAMSWATCATEPSRGSPEAPSLVRLQQLLQRLAQEPYDSLVPLWRDEIRGRRAAKVE